MWAAVLFMMVAAYITAVGRGVAYAQSCEEQGLRQIENGRCADIIINDTPPANGVVYTTDELLTLQGDLCSTRRNEAGECVPLIGRVTPGTGLGGVYTPKEVDIGNRIERADNRGVAGDGRDDIAHAKGSPEYPAKTLPRTDGPPLVSLALIGAGLMVAGTALTMLVIGQGR